jgi:hypothetical protein
MLRKMDINVISNLFNKMKICDDIAKEILHFLLGDYIIKIPYVNISWCGNFNNISFVLGNSNISENKVYFSWDYNINNKYIKDLTNNIINLGYSYYGFGSGINSPFTSGNQRRNSQSTELIKDDGTILLCTKKNLFYDIKLIFSKKIHYDEEKFNIKQESIDIKLTNKDFDYLCQKLEVKPVDSFVASKDIVIDYSF